MDWATIIGIVLSIILTKAFYSLLTKKDKKNPFPPNIYTFGRGFRYGMWILFIACLLFVTLASIGLYYETDPSERLACFSLIALFGSGALFLTPVLSRIGDKIEVTEKGILRTSSRGKETFLAWKDIEIKERPHLQRLDLTGFAGEKIKIEYQLPRFKELQKIFSEKIPTGRSLASPTAIQLPMTFHRRFSSIVVSLIQLIFFLALAGYFFFINQIFWTILFSIFAVSTVWGLLSDWKRIEVEKSGITIIFRREQMHISWSDIQNVELVSQNFDSSVTQGVLLVLSEEEHIELSGAKEGEMLLYHAIYHGYQNYQ